MCLVEKKNANTDVPKRKTTPTANKIATASQLSPEPDLLQVRFQFQFKIYEERIAELKLAMGRLKTSQVSNEKINCY